MRKAYNVYTINEKTSIRAAFRKLTLLFAFGVCFLGFQAQGTAQTYTISATPGSNLSGTSTDYNFLRTYTYVQSAEDAIEILRTQLNIVTETPARTDAEDLDGLVKGGFLTAAISNLASSGDIYNSLGKAFQTMATEPYVTNNSTSVDLQGVVEGYARLLD